jgi:hypothetical protein
MSISTKPGVNPTLLSLSATVKTCHRGTVILMTVSRSLCAGPLEPRLDTLLAIFAHSLEKVKVNGLWRR